MDLGEPLPLSYRPKTEPITQYSTAPEPGFTTFTTESDHASIPQRRPIRLSSVRRRYVLPLYNNEPVATVGSNNEGVDKAETMLRQTEIERQLAAVDMVEENVRFIRELIQLGRPVSVDRLMEILQILRDIMESQTIENKTNNRTKNNWHWDRWYVKAKESIVPVLRYLVYLGIVIMSYLAIVALYQEYTYRMD